MRRRKQNGHHSQRTGAAEKVPFSAVCLIIIIRDLYGIRLMEKGKVGQPGSRDDHEVITHPHILWTLHETCGQAHTPTHPSRRASTQLLFWLLRVRFA